MEDLPLDIDKLVKMMEEMANDPKVPFVGRLPGEMNSYEKYRIPKTEVKFKEVPNKPKGCEFNTETQKWEKIYK